MTFRNFNYDITIQYMRKNDLDGEHARFFLVHLNLRANDITYFQQYLITRFLYQLVWLAEALITKGLFFE